MLIAYECFDCFGMKNVISVLMENLISQYHANIIFLVILVILAIFGYGYDVNKPGESDMSAVVIDYNESKNPEYDSPGVGVRITSSALDVYPVGMLIEEEEKFLVSK